MKGATTATPGLDAISSPSKAEQNAVYFHKGSDVPDGPVVDRVLRALERATNGAAILAETVADVGMSIAEKVEEVVAEGMSSIIDTMNIRLPNRELVDEDGNLGNNVHIPSRFPNGHPYRLGLHIQREEIGYRVAKVFGKTLAHEAKIKESDILTHLNGKELGTKNLITVLGLFASVDITFTLTIKREVGIGEKVEFIELQLEITTHIDEVNQSFEFEVVVRAFRRRLLNGDDNPHYISQDPDGISETYMMMDDERRLAMGTDRHGNATFAIDKFYTYNDGQVCILRLAGRDLAFNCIRNTMMPFNESDDISHYLLNMTYSGDGSYVFQQVQRAGGNEGSYYLHTTGERVGLMIYASISDVPRSGRFTVTPVTPVGDHPNASGRPVRRP